MEYQKRQRGIRLRTLCLILGASIMAPLPGLAQEAGPNEVLLLDKGENGASKVFEPAILRVDVGEAVDFISWDFGHDLESVEGLAPDGSAPFSGYKNADTNVVFEQEGVYVYQCAAHKEVGMVGVVVAGEPVNLDAILANYESHPSLSEGARERLGVILDELKS